MKDLTLNELVEINGGSVPDSGLEYANETAYGVGYRIGRAVARTINQFKAIFS